jgi:hypothetical protein
MLPSTVELLRDILREAEFLETEARRTTREAFLSDEVLTSRQANNAKSCTRSRRRVARRRCAMWHWRDRDSANSCSRGAAAGRRDAR